MGLSFLDRGGARFDPGDPDQRQSQNTHICGLCELLLYKYLGVVPNRHQVPRIGTILLWLKGNEMDAGALEALITQQTVTAMKAHDAVRTGTLRLIKNALKNKAIEKREPLTPAEEQQALATMIKQRRDSIEQFTKGNRPELAAIEAAEIVVIEEFLPKALDEAGLLALVNEAIAEITASAGKAPTPKEIGVVIKAVQGKLQAAGLRAEGRLVSEAVKKALAG
jgi:uncharacterized protein YqeY